MKSRLLFSLVVIAFAAVATAQTTFKKYDIKSGIVTFETTMQMGTMDMKEKAVVYFDDYGMKECKDTYSDDKLVSSFFSDGKNRYVVKYKGKTAYSQGPAYRGTELRVEWSEFGTPKDRESGKIKKLPAMTVAGKNCEVFETNDGKGTIARYAGWKKILLYMDVQTKSVRTTLQAVKVEENAKVPPEKFAVPAGFTIQK
jgi:hypothetical protein